MSLALDIDLHEYQQQLFENVQKFLAGDLSLDSDDSDEEGEEGDSGPLGNASASCATAEIGNNVATPDPDPCDPREQGQASACERRLV